MNATTPINRLACLLSVFVLICSVGLANPQTDSRSAHVLIIGIDGVRPDALLEAHTPHLDRLAWNGRTSWQAIAGGGLGDATQQATSSGPGWSSILTGVWVDKHKVVDNNFENNNLGRYPHFFARIRKARPDADLASIVHWNPINDHLLKPFPGLATSLQETESDQGVEDAAAKYLAEANPVALFLHFDEIDGAGHGHGYGIGIPQYLESIEKVDAHVGGVLAALKGRATYAQEDWLVLITTDHGGIDKGHGGQSLDERTIWLIANGRQVTPGALPSGLGHTVIAPTALEHLGIEVPKDSGMVPALDLQDGDLQTDVHVMSFNIRYGTANDGDNSWPKRKHLVMDVIRDRRPGILGLQEALRFQLDEIKVQFPNLQEVGVGRDDGKTKGEYAAILFDRQRFQLVLQDTFWFSDTPYRVASTSWGNSIPRICTMAVLLDRHTGQTVVACNAHWDHRSQPSRLASAELLVRRLRHLGGQDTSVLVLGDFNAGEGNPAFVHLLGKQPHGLRDSFRVLHPKEQEVGTFNGFKGDSSGQKIDAVLVGKKWQVLESGILRTPKGQPSPSDHDPVWARLGFGER